MTFQVLIIDDDQSFRKLLELRLNSFVQDLNVVTFDSLAAAKIYLEQSGNRDFDLVLVDEHLPDGRGAQLISEGWFENLAVLSISSDESPEIPGSSIQAGATFFLNKRHISEPLFKPLVQGMLERNKLQRQVNAMRTKSTILETVKTLVGTLRHEINNPLGAVLGAAYVLQRNAGTTPEQKEAANLVESSGKRIKHVLEELCKAVELEPVTKASHKVFHIPGDAPWDKDKR